MEVRCFLKNRDEVVLTASWTGFTRLDYSHVSGSYSVNTQVTPLYRPAYNIGDVRLGGIGAEIPGQPHFVINQPRTAGIDARVRFK